MEIATGIGNTLLAMPGGTIVGWAQRAEDRGFSSLASIGRAAWPGYDELAAFAAAVTGRIGLLTDVLLAPTSGKSSKNRTKTLWCGINGDRRDRSREWFRSWRPPGQRRAK